VNLFANFSATKISNVLLPFSYRYWEFFKFVAMRSLMSQRLYDIVVTFAAKAWLSYSPLIFQRFKYMVLMIKPEL